MQHAHHSKLTTMTASELRKLNTPSPQRRGMLSRSNSRSKGINFNTVTPSPLKTLNTTSRQILAETLTSGNQQKAGKRGQIDRRSQPPASQKNLQYDFVLPLAEHLKGLDIDEQLRLLALKEMNVVEIKDSISNLKNKLDLTENDLRCLREVIQRSLYKEMNVQGTPKSQAKTPVSQGRSRRRIGVDRSIELKENHPPGLSKIWSNLSKPITFIQQIDSMIQNEFEKSLSADHQSPAIKGPRANADKSSLENNDSDQRDSDSNPSPLRDRSNYTTSYYQHLLQYSENPEDMLQAVSSSLWSFVNDVKTNMLATPTEQEMAGKPASGPSTNDSEKPDDNPMDMLSLSDEDSYSDDVGEVDLTMYSSMRRNNEKS